MNCRQPLAGRYLLILGMVLTLVAGSIPVQAISLAEEIELGQKIDAEILKQTPLSDDEAAQKEIEEYGQKLVEDVRRPEIEYHFKILAGEDLNAFAVPGGYVYFSERLWNVFRKDERIGVLAHEIVHIDRRHALDAISKRQRRRIWLAVLLTVVGANRTWGDVAGLAESMYTLKYSRGDEQQADGVGVELTEKAGYNPAGLLGAMRKIKRFEEERGGAPPKIFSSHPPTGDRLAYLEQLITDKGVPVPPEDVKELTSPHRVGTVMAVADDTVEFGASKPLELGDVVWVMGKGWDYHYENRTAVPIARAVIIKTGTRPTARVWPMATAKKGEIAAGAAVHDPPEPAPPVGIGTIEPISHHAGSLGKLSSETQLSEFDRLLGVQSVWDEKHENLINDHVGYVVIRDPTSPTGFAAIGRPKYSYAPLAERSVLVRLKDPDHERWVGPIVSIGRGGQTIEVLPNREMDPDKTYEVTCPAWNEDSGYSKRVVGTARLQSTGKIVLKMASYRVGWSIHDVQNGFDVYEKSEDEEAASIPSPGGEG